MTRGFSLVESLVAMVVLSVGLLGAAALLLGSLRQQAQALRFASATALVADMAGRIRANPAARAHYDSRSSTRPADCSAGAVCDSEAMAAWDLAQFTAAARATLPHRDPQVTVTFEPAIGPARTDSYRIALRWRESAGAVTTDEITLVVLAQPPVAGAA